MSERNIMSRHSGASRKLVVLLLWIPVFTGMTTSLAVIARFIRAIQFNAGLDYRNKSGNDTLGVIAR